MASKEVESKSEGETATVDAAEEKPTEEPTATTTPATTEEPATTNTPAANDNKEEEETTKEEEIKEAEPKKEEEAKEEEGVKEDGKTDDDKADSGMPEAEKEAASVSPSTEEKKEEPPAPEEDDANAIWEPAPPDVLSGRGASVNAHPGNKKFRALCFARKPEFEAGNHAAKRRVATEIVTTTFDGGKARFLKKKRDKGPWHEMTKEQAILKACQVMRDYKRPDRMAMREMMQQNGQARKRSRSQEPSTPLLETPVPAGPLEPIIENPFGVHDHDVLSGRGAFVNGHVGNARLRSLALERKARFDAGNYTEKRSLATEIVQIVRALKPPGRFLKKVTPKKPAAGKESVEEKTSNGLSDEWEELSDEKAIHKACQVMRDIDRPDRKDRELRRAKKKQKLSTGEAKTTLDETPSKEEGGKEATKEEKASAMDVLASTSAEKTVQDAVAETEQALDKALDAASEVKEKVEEAAAVEV
eukprot:scaffold6784_cov108-Cylindrotheca_fusiformis.AAC.6